MKIYESRVARKFFIPIIKKIGSDVKIRHHWVRDTFVNLHTFAHKGYWFYGKKREFNTMLLFKEVIKSGDKVIEVGGHIGYISIFFSYLVGSLGSVIVFESGGNNLPYLRKNIEANGLDNTKLLEYAIGDSKGEALFYEDDLTGQNNSLVKDFEGLKSNTVNSYVPVRINERKVIVTTLDAEFFDIEINFIKIDIEGGEWPAIIGGINLIHKYLPAFMVEIQANEIEIFNFFTGNSYIGFDENRIIIHRHEDLKGNIFWLHKRKHNSLIGNLGLK